MLEQKAIEVMENQDPGLGIFKTKFEKHTGEYGNYYSLGGDWRNREPSEFLQLHLIAEFLNMNPNLLDSNLSDTMFEIINTPEGLLEAREAVKAIEALKQ